MAPKPFTSFLRDQWAHLPDTYEDLTGKTVIVVGANVGLGYEAAKKFAKMNPGRLILACRNKEKGDNAVKMISEATGCKTVECWTVDLASFKSVSAFADRFAAEGGGRLDILLENAGIANVKFESTKDGWEQTLQVNHLGTVLLGLLLLPVVASTPGSPRITIVSSELHYHVIKLREADSSNIFSKLNDPDTPLTRERYNVTKLFNVFFTRSFAEKLKPSVPVTVNVVNPGLCVSELRRKISFPLSIILSLFVALVSRTTEVGSRTLTHASLLGTKEEVHGKYLNKCQVERESEYVYTADGAKVQDRV